MTTPRPFLRPLVAGLALALAPATVSGQAEPPSLEALLRRARAEERAVLERLREPVRMVVRALEEASGPEELERRSADLRELGPEAAPLLIAHLAPGPEPTAGQLQRAGAVADALRAWGAPGTLDQLTAMLRGADARARSQAAGVLPFVAERDRAREVLTELLGATDQGARLDAARGLSELARLGDEASVAPLRSLLIEDGPSLVRAALVALSAAEDGEAEEQVRRLAGDARRVLPLLDALEAYYLATDSVRGPVAVDLVRTTAAGSLSTDEVQALLGTVTALEPKLDRDLERAFEPLLTDSRPEVRDEARIALTLLGDRSARRELLSKYDDLVQDRAAWPDVYERRAAIQLRIRAYGDAVDDLETAAELYKNRAGSNRAPQDTLVTLARAQVLDGKLRQAHESLTEAYLSAKRLEELRADPDFRELVEHSRYGKLFR